MIEKSYKSLFSGSIDVSLKTAASILSTYPDSARAFAEIGRGQKAAQKRRKALAADGLEVPPLTIVSTTDACNLACAGCYACANKKEPGEALSDERIAELLNAASGLGVSIVMLAGGEPLLSHGWLEALGAHKEMAGIVFTNGTLIDKSQREWFSRHRHIIPAFSIEGGEEQTDARRGSGVYETVTAAMNDLRAEGIPFGISVTMTSQNIDDNLQNTFIEQYLKMGCCLFVFVEYVPVETGTEPLVLSKQEKRRLGEASDAYAQKYPALFIPFPGDEEQYGGCLAAGRGFIHISASGAVEPCPFAPFSDVSIKDTPLRVALASRFLSRVRENHHLLKEGDGGCALWHNREWLQEIL
jgi:MoaA/NifB/PqqE/SkfB family radical SAM enzyme